MPGAIVERMAGRPEEMKAPMFWSEGATTISLRWIRPLPSLWATRLETLRSLADMRRCFAGTIVEP
jgi:hypothetical protein